MLKVKPFKKIIGYENSRRILPEDEEILICLNCPLPKCSNTYQCKRFIEERSRIRRELHGKKHSKGIKKDTLQLP